MRFSPTSGTRSATVPIATRSRYSFSLMRNATGWFSARSCLSRPCTSLNTRPTVQRLRQGASSGAGVHVGIDQDAAAERFLLRTVVVDHDRVHPLRLQIGELVMRVGAAVQRDEEIRPAGLQRPVDGPAAQAVALLEAPRHHEARIEAEAPQHAHEQRRAAHAVDVVVAQHHQRLAPGDGPLEAGDGGVEIDEQERVLQFGQRRPQEPRGGVGRRGGRCAAAARRAPGSRPAGG